MDTRSKIVDTLPPNCEIVEGFFDPLLADHAEQLNSIEKTRPLAVVIRDPEEPLLNSRARAELVAALKCVDYVVIGGTYAARALQEDRDSLMQVIRTKHGK